MKRLVYLASAAVLGVATPASAVMIDDFDVVQNISAIGGSALNPLSVFGSADGPAASIIGSQRDVRITRNAGAAIVNVDVNGSTPGAASISINASLPPTDAVILFQWDGTQAVPDISNAMQLGGVDLTAGGEQVIALGILNNDLDVNYQITLYDGTNSASVLQAITNGQSNVPGGVTLAFDLASFAGVNVASVTAIELAVSGAPAFDTVIDFIETRAVSEPAMIGIFGIALLGLGLARRRAIV